MNLQITDEYVYTIYRFAIEDDNGKLYYAALTDGEDIDEEWEILDENGDEIDEDLEDELIAICEEQLIKNQNKNGHTPFDT